MATLAFTELPAASYAPARDPHGRDGRLSPLEWSVVALAAHDPLETIERPGRIARAFATLFGVMPTNMLADERLEALRRLSVLLWHHGTLPGSRAVKEFMRAGFSARQLKSVAASIERYRDRRATAATATSRNDGNGPFLHAHA